MCVCVIERERGWCVCVCVCVREREIFVPRKINSAHTRLAEFCTACAGILGAYSIARLIIRVEGVEVIEVS